MDSVAKIALLMLVFYYGSDGEGTNEIDALKAYHARKGIIVKVVLEDSFSILVDYGAMNNFDSARLFASRIGLRACKLGRRSNLSAKEYFPEGFKHFSLFLYDYYYPLWKENAGSRLLYSIHRSAVIFDDVSAVRKRSCETDIPNRDATSSGFISFVKKLLDESGKEVLTLEDSIDIEFKSGDQKPLASDLNKLENGPGKVKVYIHNGITTGFTAGFQSHSNRMKNCFILPHEGYAEILAHEMYSKVQNNPDFVKSYLLNLSKDYKYDKQTCKKRKTEVGASNTLQNFQNIDDKSIFFGPPVLNVKPSLYLSSGDSDFKREKVNVFQIQRLKNKCDGSFEYFKLVDGEETKDPQSKKKSRFLDDDATFEVIQAYKTQEDGIFKAKKNDYSVLVKSLILY